MKKSGKTIPAKRLLSIVFLTPYQILLITFPLTSGLMIWAPPRILLLFSLLSLGFFTGGFLLSLIFKRAYCGHLCGITALITLQKILFEKKVNSSRPIPLTIGFIINVLKCIFPVVLFLVWKLGNLPPLPIPFIILCGIYPLSVVLSLTIGKSSEQHFLCPLAPYLLTGSRLGKVFRQLSILTAPEKCRGCGRCTEKCLNGNKIPVMLNPGDWKLRTCLYCGECIASCHSGALSYGFIKE